MVDPRTPVIVGVGQFTERIDLPGYRGMSSVELATEAARAALADTGADVGAVTEAIDVFAALRQFEISTPFSAAPLGCSDNYPRSVAARLGADPARAVLEPLGGSGSQKVVTEFSAVIAAGDAEVVLVLGSENGSTLRHFARREDKPDHSEKVGGQLEDRGYGFEQYMDEYTATHGLTGAPVQYGLLDNARRAKLGATVADYRTAMAELFAPFSKVAAKNPFSSSPVERSVDELATVTPENRMICDPYPRLMVARDQVNQGAAVLIMSVAAARRLAVSSPPMARRARSSGALSSVTRLGSSRKRSTTICAGAGSPVAAWPATGAGAAASGSTRAWAQAPRSRRAQRAGIGRIFMGRFLWRKWLHATFPMKKPSQRASHHTDGPFA